MTYSFLTSKERDIETGLDYFLARYYSSVQGRFTSPDEFTGGPEQLFYFEETASSNPTFYAELEEPQSLNKYQYALNNPLRYIDPDGHQAMADSLRQAGAQWEASAPPQLKIVGRVLIIGGAAIALLSNMKVENPSPCIGGLDCSAYYIDKARREAEQARNAEKSQQQNQSNTASPNPNDPDKKPCSERGGHRQPAQQWAVVRAGASTSKIQILGSEPGKFIISRETRNICTTRIQRVSSVHRRLKINDSSMIPKYKER